jgi:hypothetical protein
MRFPPNPHLPQGFRPENVHTHGHRPPDPGYSAAAAVPEANASVAVLAPPICCIECRRPWVVDAERWRIKLLLEDDAAPETVPYCPECHEREFGAE